MRQNKEFLGELGENKYGTGILNIWAIDLEPEELKSKQSKSKWRLW